MDKLFFIIMTALACCSSLSAQHRSLGPLHSADSPRRDWLLPGDTLFTQGDTIVYSGKPVKQTEPSTQFSIIQPAYSNRALASIPDSAYTGNYRLPLWEPYGYWPWGLHKGLNVQLGLSAFITPGSDAPHNGGFTQSISAAYLAPLTKNGKLWMLAGGEFNHINWGSDNYRDAGLYALLGYRFNDHWQAYAYGKLSLANNYGSYYNRYYAAGLMPYGAYAPFYGGMGYGPTLTAPGANAVGAGVIYSPNRNISIGVEVQGAWYDDRVPHYYKQYNYPVPEVK